MLEHNAEVTVTHDASGFSFGVMRSREGGGKEGEAVLDRPGGMAPPEAFAGTWEFGSVTVAKALSHGRDSGLIHKAYDLHGDRFTIHEQPLDAKGKPGFHRPNKWTGLLVTSTPPNYERDSNDRAVLEMEFAVDGFA